MKNVLKPLAKSFFVRLGLMAAVSSRDAAIQKKILGSGHPSDLAKRTTLVFLNEEIDDIIRIVKSLKDPGLLIQAVSGAVENEVKEQKGGYLGTLAATLGSILL